MKLSWMTACMLILPVVGRAEEPIRFDRDVRPILSDRCFQCHGPDAHDRQGGLRLDRPDGPEGAHRYAIKPGSPEESDLWYRITAEGDERMPPPDSPKKPLSEAEKRAIRRWIEQGAEYEAFWAFVPPRRPELPEVDDQRFSRHPIDRLVLDRLNSEQLAPSPAADRRTLIRRLSFDLTGLPPTRAEVHHFLADTSPDAYERLVDRLLGKPQYGEHMARYWLDLVRFADTNGLHHDHYRELTPYRDWVIRAFNANLPYDAFLSYQLAGDLYSEPSRDQLVASGFHRLHLIIDRGTALPEESFNRNVIDRVTAVSTAFLGLTMQCAICHDHKYDPITAREFYQFYAFFNNLDAEPETGGRQGSDFRRGLQPPYISLATPEQQERLDALDRRIAEARTRLEALEQRAKENATSEGEGPSADDLAAARQALKEAQAERQAFEATIPMAMVMRERPEPRPAHILIRGAYDQPGEPVERGTPAFLPPMQHDGLATRMDLARWFAAPDHPLTARVAVNRLWQQLFGVGIVKTSEDFGAQGEWPQHPELLDYLAVRFVESGWDVKSLLKHIVLSETYRQASAAAPERFEADPANRLLARGSRFRLDAEVIRDQVLATSGLMNDEMFGKSVKPPQPPGLWKAVAMPDSYPRVYVPDTGNQIYRRSIYTFWKRAMPPPQMTILNAPTREECIAGRERTNTPLQALLLMNEPEYLKAARHLARQALTDGDSDPADRVAVLYETITSRVPDAEETATLLQLVDDLEERYRRDASLADRLCEGVALGEGKSAAELAAWTMMVSTIYNLDITRTRE